eukprot:jgi/Mesvir1/28249/Mv04789-RA.1
MASDVVGTGSKGEKGWVEQQKKTFVRWMNSRLGPTNHAMHVKDICNDLGDGLRIFALLERVSGQDIGKPPNKVANSRFQKLENVSTVLQALEKKLGVKMVNIGADDIVDSQLKLILGLIWTIINKFQLSAINTGEQSGKSGLLLWAQRATAGYKDVKVTNFTTSLQDGLALCAILHKHRPDAIDFEAARAAPSDLRRLQMALDGARAINIPVHVDAEDVVEEADEKSMLTQVSELFHFFSSAQNENVAAKRLTKMVERVREIEAQKASCVQQCTVVRDWLADKKAQFEHPKTLSSLVDVENAMESYNAYLGQERVSARKEGEEAQKLVQSLAVRLQAENAPPFTLPKGLSIADLEEGWKALVETEQRYVQSLRVQKQRWARLEALLWEVEQRTMHAGNWATLAGGFLDQPAKIPTDTPLSYCVQATDRFEESLGLQTEYLKPAAGLMKQVVAAGHSRAAAVEAQLQGVLGRMQGLESALGQRKAALKAALERRPRQEELSLQYAQLADAAVNAMNVLELEVRRPLGTDEAEALPGSVQEAGEQGRRLKESLELMNELRALLVDVDGKVAEYGALHKELQGYGGVDLPYGLPREDLLRERLTGMNRSLDERVATQQAKLADLERIRALVAAYRGKAEAMVTFCTEHSAKVLACIQRYGQQQAKGCDEGAVEKGLEEVAQLKQSIQSQGRELLNNVKERMEELRKLSSDEGVEVSLLPEALDIRFGSMLTSLSDAKKLLEQRLLQKASDALSPELMSDIKAVFLEFDKDKDGYLSKDELAECLQALGQSVDASSLDALVAGGSGKGNKLDQAALVDFMRRRVRETESKEDVKLAFESLSKGAAFVTEEQLRACGLAPAVIAFLRDHMPVTSGGAGYDFQALLRNVFED